MDFLEPDSSVMLNRLSWNSGRNRQVQPNENIFWADVGKSSLREKIIELCQILTESICPYHLDQFPDEGSNLVQ